MKSIILYPISALLGYQYAILSQWNDPKIANYEAHGYYLKPFVYRALLPLIAQFLQWLGIKPEISLPILISLCAVLFVAGMMYLLQIYIVPRAEIIAFLSLAGFFILFSNYAHSY